MRVGGEGFAVDASLIKADANRQRSVPDSEGLPPDAASHAQSEPDALGGHFEFATWNGLPVTAADFRDHWIFLYVGYARCLGSCLAVAPNIAAAAKALRQRGVTAKAVFIDLESPPVE